MTNDQTLQLGQVEAGLHLVLEGSVGRPKFGPSSKLLHHQANIAHEMEMALVRPLVDLHARHGLGVIETQRTTFPVP